MTQLSLELLILVAGSMFCIIGFLFKRTLDGIEESLKVIKEDVQQIKIVQAKHEVRITNIRQ